MRRTIYLLILMMVPVWTMAQDRTLDCTVFHTGKFSYFDSLNHTVFVTRKASRQREHNAQTNETTILALKWIDDCTYSLRLLRRNGKLLPPGQKQVTVVHITRIIGVSEGYEYSCDCTYTGSPMKNTGIMRKEPV